MMINTTETDLQRTAFFKRIKEASLLCRKINNKFSKRIINLLEERTSMTVTEILISLRLLQSDASRHLAILRRAGIIKARRQGKQIYYELNNDNIVMLIKFAELSLTDNLD